MDEVRNRFTDVRGNLNRVSLKAAVAELVGVAAFVLLGLTTVIYTESMTTDSFMRYAVIGTIFGIALTFMIFATAHTSGGHLNPAVTLAMMASGVTPPFEGMVMIVGQVLGGIVAALLLMIIVPHHFLKHTQLGINVLPAGVQWTSAFLAELVGTFIFTVVILETVCHKKSKAGAAAPLAIGFSFAAVITAFAPISSASFNPARSIGPAIVSMHFRHLWIWILGPILGALLAVPFHLASVSGYDTVYSVAQNRPEGSSSAAAEPLLPSSGNTV